MTIILPVTENINLKTIELKDAEELFNVIRKNDSHLRKWLGWLDEDKSVEDIEKYIRGSEARFDSNEGIDFLIWEHDKLIGGIALHSTDISHKKTSLMYWLAEDAQGKGIMLHCLEVLIEYIFNTLKLNRIVIGCATENLKSSALPKKLGFTFEGISREANWLYDHFVDIEVYSLLSKEWDNLSR